MFGHRYFGARYFGPAYWGDGGNLAPSEKTSSGGYDVREQSHNIIKPSGEPLRRKKKPEPVVVAVQQTAPEVASPVVEVTAKGTVVSQPYVEPVLPEVLEKRRQRLAAEKLLLELFIDA